MIRITDSHTIIVRLGRAKHKIPETRLHRHRLSSFPSPASLRLHVIVTVRSLVSRSRVVASTCTSKVFARSPPRGSPSSSRWNCRRVVHMPRAPFNEQRTICANTPATKRPVYHNSEAATVHINRRCDALTVWPSSHNPSFIGTTCESYFRRIVRSGHRHRARPPRVSRSRHFPAQPDVYLNDGRPRFQRRAAASRRVT